MIKFALKDKSEEFEITDDFEIKGTHQTWVNILKDIIDLTFSDFHAYSGDPTLTLESKLKEMGFKILEVKLPDEDDEVIY